MAKRKTQQQTVDRDEEFSSEEFAKFETSMDKVKACRVHRNRKPSFRRAYRPEGTKVIKFYGLCPQCAFALASPAPISFNRPQSKATRSRK